MDSSTNELLEQIVGEHGMGALKDWQKYWPPNYNVAPTQDVPVAGSHQGERTIETVRWGMVAPYAKEFGGKPTINARIETVATNGMFKQPFLNHRVVVPALGGDDHLLRAALHFHTPVPRHKAQAPGGALDPGFDLPGLVFHIGKKTDHAQGGGRE